MGERGQETKTTINDIAKLCGVSKATVSRVLNGEKGKYSEDVEKRVLEAIQKTGYRPSNIARGLAKRKSGAIGLMVPELSLGFFAELAQGVQHVLFQNGYQVLLCYAPYVTQQVSKITASLLSHPVEGIITACGIPDTSEVPVVHVDRHLHDFEHYGVYFPNRNVCFDMTAMFYGCGHREIAMIAGPTVTSTGVYRLEGYMKFLKEHKGMVPMVEYGDYTIESGYLAAGRLLRKRKKFTALMVANDDMAIGALKMLKEQGIRVPEDVEVMSIDDSTMCSFVTPQLSSVSQKTFEMGSKAAQLMLDILEKDEEDPELVRVKTQADWVFRESTNPECEAFFEKYKKEFREGLEVR